MSAENVARIERDFHLIADPTLTITLVFWVPMTLGVLNVWVSKTAFKSLAMRTSVLGFVFVAAGFAASVASAALA